MTQPEQALEAARAAAAEMRARGAYPATDVERARETETAVSLETSVAVSSETAVAVSLEILFDWALIDPDLREVRSTRKLGAPVTWLKLGLVRLLRQYHAELIAQQTRFNVHLLGHVRRLEARIEELERERR